MYGEYLYWRFDLQPEWWQSYVDYDRRIPDAPDPTFPWQRLVVQVDEVVAEWPERYQSYADYSRQIEDALPQGQQLASRADFDPNDEVENYQSYTLFRDLQVVVLEFPQGESVLTLSQVLSGTWTSRVQFCIPPDAAEGVSALKEKRDPDFNRS